MLYSYEIIVENKEFHNGVNFECTPIWLYHSEKAIEAACRFTLQLVQTHIPNPGQLSIPESILLYSIGFTPSKDKMSSWRLDMKGLTLPHVFKCLVSRMECWLVWEITKP